MDNLVKKGGSERSTVEEVLYTSSASSVGAFNVTLSDNISEYKEFKIEYYSWERSDLKTVYIVKEMLEETSSWTTGLHSAFGTVNPSGQQYARGVRLSGTTILQFTTGYNSSQGLSVYACNVIKITGYKYA